MAHTALGPAPLPALTMRISGSIALITGASSGIGAACAAELGRRGATLVLTGRDPARLAAAARPQDLALPGDLCDPAFRARLVDTVHQRFGRLDILLNNAGYGLYAAPTLSALDDVRAMFELNLFAPLDLIQRVAPLMKGQGSGIIVNISSVAGRLTLPWFTLYSASKFALCALSEGLRTELAPAGIGVMIVCPGYVRTAFLENVRGATLPAALRKPSRFVTTAEECALAIVRGIENGARTVTTPASARLLLLASRLFPWQTERFLARFHRQLEQEA